MPSALGGIAHSLALTACYPHERLVLRRVV
jgi:hypothetical protein